MVPSVFCSLVHGLAVVSVLGLVGPFYVDECGCPCVEWLVLLYVPLSLMTHDMLPMSMLVVKYIRRMQFVLLLLCTC